MPSRGVAIKVANRPETKWPDSPLPPDADPAAVASATGSWISNSPHRFRQKSVTATASAATKAGS